jgi:hypothetical protein
MRGFLGIAVPLRFGLEQSSVVLTNDKDHFNAIDYQLSPTPFFDGLSTL